MKKKIKIKCVGFWPWFTEEGNYILDLIKENFDLEICENKEKADYIFCCCGFGYPYEYVKYPQPRIMFSGENYVPDFNLIDYGVSVYPIEFLDRHVYLPGFMGHKDYFELPNFRNVTKKILKEKIYFANLITGDDDINHMRSKLFYKLSEYKRVESCGKYLNNMENGFRVEYGKTKIPFQEKTKFTICVNSTNQEGFITEKIFDAFKSNTIPIYFGSSTVKDIFNDKAYINCSDYDNLDDVLERVKELDMDDEKYIAMLREPIFKNENFLQEKHEELKRFVKNIFDQPIEKCYRRSREFCAQDINNFLISVNADTIKKQLVIDKKNKEKQIRKQHIKERIQQLKSGKKYFRAFLTWLKHFWFLYFK